MQVIYGVVLFLLFPQGKTVRDCPTCPEMVVIPAGTFTMGSSPSEKSWAATHGGNLASVADESPQHVVSIKSFALSKDDVTRDEYATFVWETGHPAGDGCQISPSANGYFDGNGKNVDGLFRLPSESEWEYAARGGTSTFFWWGDDDAGAQAHAWFKGNSERNPADYRDAIMGFRVARSLASSPLHSGRMRFSGIPPLVLLGLTASTSQMASGAAGSVRSLWKAPSLDSTVDAATRNAVIAAALKALDDGYIFPDIAAKMDRDIRARMKRGEFDSLSSAPLFAKTLTADLRSVSHDKHIVVEWSEQPVPVRTTVTMSAKDSAEQRARQRKESEALNFGFRKVERMSGNIGYLNLSYFDRTDYAKSTVEATMAFLRYTDGLIIDVSDNDGGRPEMVSLLISYLMPSGAALTGIYWRRDGRVSPSATVPVPDSLKYLGRPVYLLTSNAGTISAGEAFVYDLQLLKRAIVVGEVTAGAANPGGMVRIGEHFSLFVPTGRAVSPITGTNWEGTGIKPDLEVPASQALKTAHLAALKVLEKNAVDPDRRNYLHSVIEELEKH